MTIIAMVSLIANSCWLKYSRIRASDWPKQAKVLSLIGSVPVNWRKPAVKTWKKLIYAHFYCLSERSKNARFSGLAEWKVQRVACGNVWKMKPTLIQYPHTHAIDSGVQVLKQGGLNSSFPLYWQQPTLAVGPSHTRTHTHTHTHTVSCAQPVPGSSKTHWLFKLLLIKKLSLHSMTNAIR